MNMLSFFRNSTSGTSSDPRKRTVRPLLEGLEDRLLLYSAYGGSFVYGSRITYSFMPDGTSVGGSPSVLFQTLNAKFSTATWQLQFQKAAAVWQAVANINLSQVYDNGSPEACNGNQQGDPRFGDIRIGMVNLGGGALGETFLPPPFNGGTEAGDVFLNSAASWRINTDYDLETVAIHEFGHALGLGESQIASACMYGYYNGMEQSLTSDDVAGIRSVWGAPQPDQFNSNGQSNSSYTNPANITSYIDANGQIAIPSLRITSGSQSEWFSVTVPSSTTGTMVVTEQSSTLSMMSPKMMVYTSALGLLGSSSSTAYGDTISVSVSGVKAGQTYLIRAGGNSAGDSTGGFGLELNFGSVYQPPIAPPNTVVPQQPDQGGGTANTNLPGQVGGTANTNLQVITIGTLTTRGSVLRVKQPSGRGAGSPGTSSLAATQPAGNLAALQVVSTQPQLSASPLSGGTNLAGTGHGLPGWSVLGSGPSTYQAIDSIITGSKPRNRLSLFTKVNTPVRPLPA